jgi:hypothetical protein
VFLLLSDKDQLLLCKLLQVLLYVELPLCALHQHLLVQSH